MNACTTRDATPADVPALHRLMQGLSVYEQYDDVFAVTPEYVREQGFERQPPGFRALVAEAADGRVVGMLVYFFQTFAMRAKPTLYMKELFVAEDARGAGAGEALLRHAARIAAEHGCAVLKWQVARWNDGAVRFYTRLGARADDVWVDYFLGEEQIRALAAGSGPVRGA